VAKGKREKVEHLCKDECLRGNERADCCGSRNDQYYFCTRTAGHDGPHVACTFEKHDVAVWENLTKEGENTK
jgi:hypothetical protein